MNTRHAVVLDNMLVLVNPDKKGVTKHRLTSTPRTIADVWQLGQQYGFTHAWAMPETALSLAENDVLLTSDEYDVFPHLAELKEEERLHNFARVWLKGGSGHQVKLGYPHRSNWNWTAKHPVDVLVTITYLEELLGVPVEWSAGHMGFDMLKALHTAVDKKPWLRASEINLKTLPFNHAARDVIWKDENPVLPLGWYLVEVDRGSSYLAGCQGGKVGCGTPIHVDGKELAYPLKNPGIYQIDVHEMPAPYDGVILPKIITTPWVTLDVLQFALSKGYRLTINEAWIFEESHRLLDTWAKNLWDARTVLHPEKGKKRANAVAQESAYETIKTIACISVGRFARHDINEERKRKQQETEEKKDKYNDELMRANWWADKVGTARKNFLYALGNWYKNHNIKPVLVYNDAAFIAVPTPDIYEHLPEIKAKRDDLGGYKNEGTILITPELIEKFAVLNETKLLTYIYAQEVVA